MATKAERKLKKRYQKMIRDFVKESKGGSYVSLSVIYRGVCLLLYVFRPGVKTPRSLGRDLVSFLAENDRVIDEVLMAKTGHFPTENLSYKSLESMTTAYAQSLAENTQVFYLPQKVYRELTWNLRVCDKFGAGYSVGSLFKALNKKQKLSEREYRDALAVLIEERAIVLTRNGFVWLIDDANKKLGVTIDVTPREIRGRR